MSNGSFSFKCSTVKTKGSRSQENGLSWAQNLQHLDTHLPRLPCWEGPIKSSLIVFKAEQINPDMNTTKAEEAEEDGHSNQTDRVLWDTSSQHKYQEKSH